ncbi:ABC transporter permease [Planctomycetales bacterium]|nr:ABC transporter permease [Planctomycetales bacterium]
MKYLLVPALLVLLLILTLVLLPCWGQTIHLPGSEIYDLRFQRMLLALLSGSGLALCGLVFQAMFRNPLATPYTLGVASGAAFGATLCLQSAIRLGLPAVILFVPTVSFGAFGGAILAVSIVFALARNTDTSSEQMLLAGVAVNFFFSSIIVLLLYLSAPHDAFQILRWTMMGGVQNACWGDNVRLSLVIFALFIFLLFQSRTLNVFVTGQNRALSLGVNTVRFRTILFVVTSLSVGAIVSITGPIGFVGLMVPHISRMLIGPDHRHLIPATAIFGALFLMLCDTAGRWACYPAELPVGIITSLLGGPFFLWLLLRRK